MHRQLAKQTLELIEDTMRADQGAAYRVLLKKWLPMMGDAYRGVESNPYRSHLGASVIGRDCARALWYGFRWACAPNFSGRILRLFNRGHLEEARVLALLEMIGVQIWQQTEDGKQFRVSGCNGHFGGSGDGVAKGIPEMPNTPVLLEFKTSSDKYFKSMVLNGVESEKPEHHVQMNIYMVKMGLSHGLYIMVNKNNDDLYAEILTADPGVAKRYEDRAQMIITTTEPPPKIHKSPSWWQCKFCDFSLICHNEGPVDRNCRTCAHSAPAENGLWACSANEILLSEDRQLKGCLTYSFNQIFHNKI